MGKVADLSLCSVMVAGALFLASCDGTPEQEGVDEVAAEVAETEVDVAGGSALSAGETPSQRTDRLREQAETDPDGADAAAIDNMSGSEVVATAINSAGYLCGKVTEMHPSNGAILVYCTEYRNGSGRVKYRVDAQAGTVEPL